MSTSTTRNVTVEEARAVLAASERAGAAADLLEEVALKFPAWQRGTPLPMPDAAYDPSPEEQQAFFDRYVAEHPGSERPRTDFRGKPAPSPAAEALLGWRLEQARAGWEAMLERRTASPACAVCGEATPDRATVAGRERPVCATCLPVVRAVAAERAGADKVGGKKTRRELAGELLERIGA